MADEGTAKTLVLIAAILQLIFVIYGAYSIVTSLGLIMLLLSDPLGILIFMMVGWIYIYYIIWIIFGVIFMLLWFLWRGNPSGHKTALIVTGILGMFLAGFLGGLLALIAGILAPKK